MQRCWVLGPQGSATTCPVPTCRCRQHVWDLQDSRLNLELLSSFQGKGLGSAGRAGGAVLPKRPLGTPGAGPAPARGLIQWGLGRTPPGTQFVLLPSGAGRMQEHPWEGWGCRPHGGGQGAAPAWAPSAD